MSAVVEKLPGVEFSSRDSIQDVWGNRTPYRGEWSSRVDMAGSQEPEKWVQSTCVFCSNGCGMDIGVKEGQIVAVRGREDDHVNRGRLGPKGLHGWEANSSTDRLTRPLIRKDGELKEASWDEAMELIVRKTKEIQDRYTSGAIGFYTSGQLLLEEYYTLAMIGKAGLGTTHMDGNTRLCTATAARALTETFGSDGQPASYADIDETDCLFIMGHNIAKTQTVLWMRMLDRRRGPNPPTMVVVDPRVTPTAQEADVHLMPNVGTNVALLNGLMNLIIENGHIDRDFIMKHTVDYSELEHLVKSYPPKVVEEITGVPQRSLREAAEILGTAPTLLSTVLQGVYQSNQATAAAVQVNNLNLIRGMIGRPGCGLLQMNGQPTAQNTRECGCDGSLPAFFNWDNMNHIRRLAELWNVEVNEIPHWDPPTHAMQIFRYAETGSIKMLWICATNPAVSMPDLPKVRKILDNPNLFVVVQDAWLTETAERADVVLPAAIWGEKTGTFTNADRTVHITHKAIDPPGEARSDFDIFVDYANRLNLIDKDGAPLIKWKTPEEAFEGWKRCTEGRLCDYTGLSYAKLCEGSGIRWPCNDKHPNGSPRLYQDGIFMTESDAAQTYGHDLITGAVIPEVEYKANDPGGRAIIKPAEYFPPQEMPDEQYPFMLTTGREVYHFHTRTKTGRTKELRAAAPDVHIQINEEDAKRIGISDGDALELTSRRGKATGKAKVGGIIPGHLFMPFHYGYWDHPDHLRAANELTLHAYDPASKQPCFKFAAVKLRKTTWEAVKSKAFQEGKLPEHEPQRQQQKPKEGEERTLFAANYLGLLSAAVDKFADALRKVGDHHHDEAELKEVTYRLADWAEEALTEIQPLRKRYKQRPEPEPKILEQTLLNQPRDGSYGLLRDLHDLWLLGNEVKISYRVLHQAAMSLRDTEFQKFCSKHEHLNKRALDWLSTRINHAAPETLVVANQ